MWRPEGTTLLLVGKPQVHKWVTHDMLERGSPSLAFQNKVGRKERTGEEVEKEGSRGRREERGTIIILLSDAAFALPPSLGPGDSSPSPTEERGLSDRRTLGHYPKQCCTIKGCHTRI